LNHTLALGIIEAIQEQGKVDLAKVEHNSALWLHTLISAIRLAFADTRAYVADPEHVRVPVEELLSKVSLSSFILFAYPVVRTSSESVSDFLHHLQRADCFSSSAGIPS